MVAAAIVYLRPINITPAPAVVAGFTQLLALAVLIFAIHYLFLSLDVWSFKLQLKEISATAVPDDPRWKDIMERAQNLDRWLGKHEMSRLVWLVQALDAEPILKEALGLGNPKRV